MSRAVFKLTSNKPARRAATLAWLEQTAAVHEPEVLTLKQGKGAELVVLVKFVRDAREGKNPHATGEGLQHSASRLAECAAIKSSTLLWAAASSQCVRPEMQIQSVN